jgi:hypothetical protein
MTQDEIIEMARQARLMSEYDETSPWVEDHEITEYVVAFAKLVAAKEREACAKVVESFGKYESDVTEAIRARGEA